MALTRSQCCGKVSARIATPCLLAAISSGIGRQGVGRQACRCLAHAAILWCGHCQAVAGETEFDARSPLA